MNYELARELKDAGFPYPIFDEGVTYRYPTLSELIEACAEKFCCLTLGVDGCWYADGPKIHQNQTDACSTPEEAVSRLWLFLNRK